MSSIFTKIIRGELPSHRVYEDDAHFACLDINPIQPGHTLVIPKREVDELYAMEPTELAALFQAAQRIAVELKAETGCARIVTLVVGYEVPHVHIHLVPTNSIEDYPIPPREALDHEQAGAFAKAMQARLPA